MARRVTIQRTPLLKVTLPIALVVAGIGIFLFLSNTATCAGAGDPVDDCTAAGQSYSERDTGILLPWILVAGLIAIAGAFVRKKDEVTLLFPTDQLKESSRADLQKVLDGLEESRRKGEIPEDRYIKARDRVLAEMGKSAKK
ncbi:MAG: hypothetical protein AABX89_01175 [Candidatus Thermoplasmatota archaeon]